MPNQVLFAPLSDARLDSAYVSSSSIESSSSQPAHLPTSAPSNPPPNAAAIIPQLTTPAATPARLVRRYHRSRRRAHRTASASVSATTSLTNDDLSTPAATRACSVTHSNLSGSTIALLPRHQHSMLPLPSFPVIVADPSSTSRLFNRKRKPVDSIDAFSVRDPMGSLVDHEYLIAQDPPAFSNWTLAFHDPDMERKYQRYFLDKQLPSWRIAAILSLVCQLSARVLLEFAFPDYVDKTLYTQVRNDMLYLFFVVVIPTVICILSTFILPRPALALAIHYITAVVILFVEPAAALVAQSPRGEANEYSAGGFGAIYVVMLGSMVFFLKLRFILVIPVVSLCCMGWCIVFGIKSYGLSATLRRVYAVNAVVLALSCVVCLFMSYEIERSSRRNYQSENRLYRQIVKLDTQLRYVQQRITSKTNDFDSPLEKAINAVRSLSASPTIPIEHLRTLSTILGWLNTPNLLAPDWCRAAVRNNKNDTERSKWISEVVGNASRVIGISSDVDDDYHCDDDHDDDDAISLESAELHHHHNEAGEATRFSPSCFAIRRGSAPASLIHSSTGVNRKKSDYSLPLPPLPLPYIPSTSSPGAQSVSGLYTPQVLACLHNLPDYNFPIFELNKLVQGHALLVLLHYLCVESGLLSRLGLDADVFMVFAQRIEQGYHPEQPCKYSVLVTSFFS
ncbi:hypothetical protein SeMB42_g00740 [Synchytrium endobioticum]|uniref:PDEase domain-containing protein n=1 Tax=Synchytrium endobioticum TaxID=286115 RepID=A0A507DP89_9FUNG|nr:hypothetical protein SeMB42_g00740 [Synchytrium endobioticum]